MKVINLLGQELANGKDIIHTVVLKKYATVQNLVVYNSKAW